ncbi:hypothetical protein FJZ28_04905 [Candidatus Peregrinibacteria bacterium]|nr:hypothetical protein [Candidatus Peregrinibacteria bacterium]
MAESQSHGQADELEHDLIKQPLWKLDEVTSNISSLDLSREENRRLAIQQLRKIDVHLRTSQDNTRRSIEHVLHKTRSVMTTYAVEEQNVLPEATVQEIDHLAKYIGLPSADIRAKMANMESSDKNQFIMKYAGLLYDSIETDFTESIFNQLQSIPDKKVQVRMLFALLSSPESVTEEDLKNLGTPMNVEAKSRYTTHEEGEGVLPGIMTGSKQLNCAGRTLIVSAVLKKLGIAHLIASPDGHSLVIVQNDDGTNTYFDAQQGLLFDFPAEALRIEGDMNSGAVANLDVHEADSPDCHSLGMVHKSFLVFNSEAGIVQQNLQNTIVAIENDWLDEGSSRPLLRRMLQMFQKGKTSSDRTLTQSWIGRVHDELFSDVRNAESQIDSMRSRIEDLLPFFSMLVQKHWKIDDDVVAYIEEKQLWGIGNSQIEKWKNTSKIVDRIQLWRSKGDGDEVAAALGAMTGKKNVKGETLEYFFRDQEGRKKVA